MEAFAQINRSKYLYLESITEPEDNTLRLVLAEAKANGPEHDMEIAGTTISGLRNIETTEGCAMYEIFFAEYICYNVANESYADNAPQDKYVGKLARLYERSAYLEFMGVSTFATSDYPGPFSHYGFCCLNHCVDVISTTKPQIVRRVVA